MALIEINMKKTAMDYSKIFMDSLQEKPWEKIAVSILFILAVAVIVYGIL